MAVIRANKRHWSLLIRSVLVASVVGLALFLIGYREEITNFANGFNERRNIPSALIIGAKHCNLGYLTDMLQWHPQLVIAQRTDYFDNDDNYAKGLEWYMKNLPKTGSNMLIERSDEYYASAKAPFRVHDLNPDMKIIFQVCEPSSRALKHYHSNNEDDEELDQFEDKTLREGGSAVNEEEDVIHKGLYAKHLARWLEVFPKEHFFFTDSNSIFHEPATEVKRLESFLGISNAVSTSDLYFNETRGTYCGKFASGRHCFGRDKKARGPKLFEYVDETTLDKMKEFYRTHNAELKNIIGKEFTWAA